MEIETKSLIECMLKTKEVSQKNCALITKIDGKVDKLLAERDNLILERDSLKQQIEELMKKLERVEQDNKQLREKKSTCIVYEEIALDVNKTIFNLNDKVFEIMKSIDVLKEIVEKPKYQFM